MTRDVVSLRTGSVAILPSAGETEVVGALPADVVVTEMVVQELRIIKVGGAFLPLAGEGVRGRRGVADVFGRARAGFGKGRRRRGGGRHGKSKGKGEEGRVFIMSDSREWTCQDKQK